jgi:hypothetical protein
MFGIRNQGVDDKAHFDTLLVEPIRRSGSTRRRLMPSSAPHVVNQAAERFSPCKGAEAELNQL